MVPTYLAELHYIFVLRSDRFSVASVRIKIWHAQYLRVLISAKCKLNPTAYGTNDTPMHIAAKSGYFDFVQLLVLADAPIDDRDSEGKTPLDHLPAAVATNIRGLVASYDVAILCSAAEQTFANKLAQSLSPYNFRVWADDTPDGADSDPESVAAAAVKRRISQARAIIWIVSMSSVGSARCKRLLVYSKQELNKSVFPIWYPQRFEKLPPDVSFYFLLQVLTVI